MNEKEVRITGYISQELDERFRRAVFHIYGLRSGAISQAIREALTLWLEKYKERIEKEVRKN